MGARLANRLLCDQFDEDGEVAQIDVTVAVEVGAGLVLRAALAGTRGHARAAHAGDE